MQTAKSYILVCSWLTKWIPATLKSLAIKQWVGWCLEVLLSPIHTADETKLSSLVASAVCTWIRDDCRRIRRCERTMQPYGSRLPTGVFTLTTLSPTSCEFVYTPPTRRDSTVSSRRRCVLGFSQKWLNGILHRCWSSPDCKLVLTVLVYNSSIRTEYQMLCIFLNHRNLLLRIQCLINKNLCIHFISGHVLWHAPGSCKR